MKKLYRMFLLTRFTLHVVNFFPFKSPAKDYIRETSEKNATTTVLSPSLLLEEEDEEIQPTVKRFAVIYVVVEK